MGKFACAVHKIGQEVFLVKDNKIIGEGYTQLMVDGMVSVEMRDERAKALIETSRQVKIWEQDYPDKKFKYSMYKFCAITGEYLDMSASDPDMLCPELEGVRVVDKDLLRYGFAPDTFAEVEGYRSFFNDMPASADVPLHESLHIYMQEVKAHAERGLNWPAQARFHLQRILAIVGDYEKAKEAVK